MPTFGIVAEGITDHAVIENILLGFFADEDEEPVVNPVQPLVDQTGKKRVSGPGGWELFFAFFQRGEHLRALQTNDYLVLQVDTDRAEDKGYDVPRREGGRALEVREVVARVVAKIEGLIGPEVFARHRSRLIFAIALIVGAIMLFSSCSARVDAGHVGIRVKLAGSSRGSANAWMIASANITPPPV